MVFTETADEQYGRLLNDPAREGVLKQVQKTLAFLEMNTRHPSLGTYEYRSFRGASGEKVWEAYVQAKPPAAYRVFFHYGPDRNEEGRRIPVITVAAITPHP